MYVNMYICMHVCMYAWHVCMHVCMYACELLKTSQKCPILCSTEIIIFPSFYNRHKNPNSCFCQCLNLHSVNARLWGKKKAQEVAKTRETHGAALEKANRLHSSTVCACVCVRKQACLKLLQRSRCKKYADFPCELQSDFIQPAANHRATLKITW